MHPEIKEALLRFRQSEQLALEDSLAARLATKMNELSSELRLKFAEKDEARRAENARLDAVLAEKLAANAAQVERENAAADNYRSGFKAGFEAAWRLPR
jgi:hypothetical protein